MPKQRRHNDFFKFEIPIYNNSLTYRFNLGRSVKVIDENYDGCLAINGGTYEEEKIINDFCYYTKREKQHE